MRNKVLVFILLSMILSACSGIVADPVEVRVDDDGAGSASDSTLSEQQSEIEPLSVSDEEIINEAEPDEIVYKLPDPNPLNLSIFLEGDHSVEAEIGLQGGTLKLDIPDGTQFILEIPQDALLSPETIRMTEIGSVEGLPFEDQLTMGINLQPAGLVFFKTVTLDIISTALDGEDDLVGFSTQSGGEDFSLQPSLTENGVIRLTIFHFSNYGITKASREVVARINSIYTPSTAAKFATNQVSTIEQLVADRDAQLDAFEGILKQWLNASILTRIENAAVFEDRLDYAVGEYIHWTGIIDYVDFVMGFDGQMRLRLAQEIDRALDLLAKTISTLIDRANNQCVQDSDPQAALRMYRYGITATALGLWGRSGLDKAAIESQVQDCFSFEFDFRSEVEGGQEDLFIVSHVVSRIPLNITNFDLSGAAIRNSGEITFDQFTLTPQPPNCVQDTTPGELEVEMQFNLNYSLINAWQIASVVPAVLNFVENPTEICKYPEYDYPYQWWGLIFNGVNYPFFKGDKMYIDLIVGNEVPMIFAEAIFYGDVPNVSNGKEWSRYSLVHTPD